MPRQTTGNRTNTSINSNMNNKEIIDVLHPQNNNTDWLLGLCRGDVLTDSGKRIQIFKVLALTLLPILGLWGFTVYGLFDSLQGKAKMEQTQTAVKISVEIGKFLDRIQRERDMSVLYLSILGPQTKTFLLNEYLLTDQALDQLTSWPLKEEAASVFHSKAKFHSFLNEHRQLLNPKNFDIYVEIAFYNSLIEPFVEWLYDAITESKMASMWKILVSYQKIVTGMEQIGIERALGVVFYVNGGFPSKSIYENYNSNVNVFKSNYRSAILYSNQIDSIFQKGVSKTGTNLTEVIEKFRYEIQHTKDVQPSIIKAQWWFDNMTLYLDSLLVMQEDLALVINGEVETVIKGEDRNLMISGLLLVVVFLMCPLVIYSVHALTSDIQKYALTLVTKTRELHREMKKTDSLLYQMVPQAVADKLKSNGSVDAEYFKSVTIMFSEIVGFTRVTTVCTPLQIVDLLNTLYTAFDEKLSNYEVYKVETINDSYMVAAGLPVRIRNRHSVEIANLALDFIDITSQRPYNTINDQRMELRIGINTGPCMAGIVGIIMPRYCLFGDTINTASRMKSCGQAGRIHLSCRAYNSLKIHNIFSMTERGKIQVKGKGMMTTYWLNGKHTAHLDDAGNIVDSPQHDQQQQQQHQSPQYQSCAVDLHGSQTSCPQSESHSVEAPDSSLGKLREKSSPLLHTTEKHDRHGEKLPSKTQESHVSKASDSLDLPTVMVVSSVEAFHNPSPSHVDNVVDGPGSQKKCKSAEAIASGRHGALESDVTNKGKKSSHSSAGEVRDGAEKLSSAVKHHDISAHAVNTHDVPGEIQDINIFSLGQMHGNVGAKEHSSISGVFD